MQIINFKLNQNKLLEHLKNKSYSQVQIKTEVNNKI